MSDVSHVGINLDPTTEGPAESVSALEREFMDDDFKSMSDENAIEITEWMAENKGDEIFGTLIDIGEVKVDPAFQSSQKRETVPRLIIKSPSGKQWGVRCYASVLCENVELKQKQGRLQIGWRVMITYLGTGGKEGRGLNPYAIYRLNTRPPRPEHLEPTE